MFSPLDDDDQQEDHRASHDMVRPDGNVAILDQNKSKASQQMERNRQPPQPSHHHHHQQQQKPKLFQTVSQWQPCVTNFSELKQNLVHATTAQNAIQMISFNPKSQSLECCLEYNHPSCKYSENEIVGSSFKFVWLGVPEKMTQAARDNFGSQYGSVVFEFSPSTIQEKFHDELQPADCRLYLRKSKKQRKTSELSSALVSSSKTSSARWEKPPSQNLPSHESTRFNENGEQGTWCKNVMFPEAAEQQIASDEVNVFTHAEIALASNKDLSCTFKIDKIRFVPHFTTICETLSPFSGKTRCILIYNGQQPCSDCCGDSTDVHTVLKRSKYASETLIKKNKVSDFRTLVLRQMQENHDSFLAKIQEKLGAEDSAAFFERFVDEFETMKAAHENQITAAKALLEKIESNLNNGSFTSFTFAMFTTASKSLRSQTGSRIASDLLAFLPGVPVTGESFIIARVKSQEASAKAKKLEDFATNNSNCLVLVFVDEVHYGSDGDVGSDDVGPLMATYLTPLKTLPNVVFIGVTATPYNFLPVEKLQDNEYKVENSNKIVQIPPPPQYIGLDAFKAYSHDIKKCRQEVEWDRKKAPNKPVKRWFFENNKFVPKNVSIQEDQSAGKPLCLFDGSISDDTNKTDETSKTIREQYSEAFKIATGPSSDNASSDAVFALSTIIKQKILTDKEVEYAGTAVIRFRSARNAEALEKAAAFVNAMNKIRNDCAILLSSSPPSIEPIPERDEPPPKHTSSINEAFGIEEEKKDKSAKEKKKCESQPKKKYAFVCLVEMLGMGDTFPEGLVKIYDVRQCFLMSKTKDGSAFREFQQLGRAFGFGERPVLIVREKTVDFDPFDPKDQKTSLVKNFFYNLGSNPTSSHRTFAILAQPQMGKTGTMLSLLWQLYFISKDNGVFKFRHKLVRFDAPPPATRTCAEIAASLLEILRTTGRAAPAAAASRGDEDHLDPGFDDDDDDEMRMSNDVDNLKDLAEAAVELFKGMKKKNAAKKSLCPFCGKWMSDLAPHCLYNCSDRKGINDKLEVPEETKRVVENAASQIKQLGGAQLRLIVLLAYHYSVEKLKSLTIELNENFVSADMKDHAEAAVELFQEMNTKSDVPKPQTKSQKKSQVPPERMQASLCPFCEEWKCSKQLSKFTDHCLVCFDKKNKTCDKVKDSKKIKIAVTSAASNLGSKQLDLVTLLVHHYSAQELKSMTTSYKISVANKKN